MASDHDSGVDSYYDTPRQRPVPKPRKSVNSKKTGKYNVIEFIEVDQMLLVHAFSDHLNITFIRQ